jgi:hypothetical protein
MSYRAQPQPTSTSGDRGVELLLLLISRPLLRACNLPTAPNTASQAAAAAVGEGVSVRQRPSHRARHGMVNWVAWRLRCGAGAKPHFFTVEGKLPRFANLSRHCGYESARALAHVLCRCVKLAM